MIINYTINGTDAGGEKWTCQGSVTAEWTKAMDAAMRDSFQQLTQGKAVFGNPGAGCRGPYQFTRVELIKQEHAA